MFIKDQQQLKLKLVFFVSHFNFSEVKTNCIHTYCEWTLKLLSCKLRTSPLSVQCLL